MSTESGSPRIVQIVPVDGLGGVESAARSMAGAGLPSDRFTLMLLAGEAIDGAAHAVTTDCRSPDSPLAHWRALREILRREPDVVIGSLWRSVPVLLLVGLLRPRVKTVYFLHLGRAMHVVDRLLSAVAIRLADEVWCDSASTAQARLSGSTRAKSCIISFVTTRPPLPPAPPAPKPNFVVWARLNHQKGIDRAIALVALLRARGLDARFAIHGPDGGEETALRAQAAALGDAAAVTFHGPLPPDALSSAAAGQTFFLHLSRFEGMAMGVVEAMQLGLVPVVTAVGEIGSYVRDGDNGIVVDPDRLDVAADRLVALLAAPERIAPLRAHAAATWQAAPIYREDVLAAAADLTTR